MTIGRPALPALSTPDQSRVVGSSSAQLRWRSLAESLVGAFLDKSLACARQRARRTSSFGAAWRVCFSMQSPSLSAPAAAAGEHGRRVARFPEGSRWRQPCQKKRYAGPRLLRGSRQGYGRMAARGSSCCRHAATGLACSGPPGPTCRSSPPPPRAQRLLTGWSKAAAQCGRGQASATCHHAAHMPNRLRSQVLLPTRKL